MDYYVMLFPPTLLPFQFSFVYTIPAHLFHQFHQEQRENYLQLAQISGKMERPKHIHQPEQTQNKSTLGCIKKLGRKKSPKNHRKYRRNQEIMLESAKKNSQSNLINQMLSFIGQQKYSFKMIERSLSRKGLSQQQCRIVHSIFNQIILLINQQRGKDYVNKKLLLRFLTPQLLTNHIFNLQQKLQKLAIISLPELCYLFRMCFYNYFRNVSPCTILISKRIGSVAAKQHLRKRQKLMHFMKSWDLPI